MKITIEQIKFARRVMNMEPISLATPVGDDCDGSEIGDFIETTEPSPEDIAIQEDNQRYIYSYLKFLDPRGNVCVRKYYGLDDGVPKTLEHIGREYGVTRERVRQIISKAIRKLSVQMKRNGATMADFTN